MLSHCGDRASLTHADVVVGDGLDHHVTTQHILLNAIPHSEGIAQVVLATLHAECITDGLVNSVAALDGATIDVDNAVVPCTPTLHHGLLGKLILLHAVEGDVTGNLELLQHRRQSLNDRAQGLLESCNRLRRVVDTLLHTFPGNDAVGADEAVCSGKQTQRRATIVAVVDDDLATG